MTCANLGYGKRNACQGGIIATCVNGEVTYDVCDDRDVCKESWQKVGAFRCNEKDPIPRIEGGSGAGGSGGTPETGSEDGAGGIIGIGGSTGGTGGTSGTGGGSGGNGGIEPGCLPTEPCPVADTGGAKIVTFGLGQNDIYFADCTTLWRVPKSGGLSQVVTTGLRLCPYSGNCVTGSRAMSVVEPNLYLVECQTINVEGSKLYRIPTDGGAKTLLAETRPVVDSIVADSSDLYWLENYGKTLKKVSTSGGEPVTLSTTESTNSHSPHLVMDSTNIYWTVGGDSYASLKVLAKGSSGPPSALPLTGVRPFDLAVNAGDAFISSTYPEVIVMVRVASGATAQVATGLRKPDYIAVDGDSVYWRARSEDWDWVFQRVPRTGGSVVTVVDTKREDDVGDFVIDDQYVYWISYSKIWRVAK